MRYGIYPQHENGPYKNAKNDLKVAIRRSMEFETPFQCGLSNFFAPSLYSDLYVNDWVDQTTGNDKFFGYAGDQSRLILPIKVTGEFQIELTEEFKFKLR